MAVVKKQTNVISSALPASWWGETWREGYFIGSGTVGANLFGGAAEERILLNHADLLWQGRISVVPDVSAKLKEVRALVEDGQYDSASDVYVRALAAKNFRPQHFYPLPMCVLTAKCSLDKGAKEYVRTLNMSSAEVNVSFLDGQARINRNCFISRENDTLVYEISKTGSGKPLDYEFSFNLPDVFNARTPNSISNMPQGIRTSYDKYFMYFTARSDDGGDYGAVAKLNHYGGSLTITEKGLRISGANNIILYLKTFVKGNYEKEFTRIKGELSAMKDPYDKLLKSHALLHQKYFGASTLSFNGTTDEYAENMLQELRKGELDCALVEKVYKYSRYLFVCSTNEQSRMFSPYGLWGASYKAFKCALPFSGAAQQVYSFAMQSNMLPLAEPLFNFIDEHMGEFKDNAIRLFNCRGVFIPTIVTNGTGRLGAVDPAVIHFTGCAGMTASLFQQYYLLTGNSKFYKSKALPFMREVALFYQDYFIKDKNGMCASNPSCLPLSTYSSAGVGTQPFSLAKDAYVDFVICRETLTNLIAGAKEQGLYAGEIPAWENMLAALPKAEKTPEGLIKDFLGNAALKNTNASNLSSLYGMKDYVDKFDLDEEYSYLLATAKKKSENAGENQNSYDMSLLAGVFAKLGQKKLAADCLAGVLRGCAMKNLAFTLTDWRGMGECGNDVWSPMQLQSNLAFSLAVHNMVLATLSDGMAIMPSMEANCNGIKAEGFLSYKGTSVDIFHNAQKSLLIIDVKAKKAVDFNMYLPEGVKKLLKSSAKVDYDAESNTVKNISLAAGKSINLQFSFRPTK